MSELDDLLDPGVGNDNMDYGRGEVLPNSTAVLVLGIISIVGCIFYGIPGLICGIIALVLHKKNKEVYATNPAKYQVSWKNAKAGYVCAIIGTSLSAVYVLVVFFALFFAFSTVTRF
jgi:hypothetical protein